MIKVLVNGCNGKMGQVICKLVSENDKLEVVAGIDRFQQITNSFPVFSQLTACDIDADVIIDFSTASIADTLIDYVLEKKIPLVLCTTGHSDSQIEKINQASKEVPILMSANMSLGVNVLAELLKGITKLLASEGYDIEIFEKHHNQKLDAPSGTALLFADAMNQVLDHEYDYTYSRHEEIKKRDSKEIGIHSMRGGTIVGEHSIYFAGMDEVIEIKHTAYSRAIFGKGAVSAALFIVDKKAGLYNMNDIIRGK